MQRFVIDVRAVYLTGKRASAEVLLLIRDAVRCVGHVYP